MGDKKKAMLSIFGSANQEQGQNIGDKRAHEAPAYPEELEIVALDFLKAIATKDVKGLCQAIQAAFECLDSMPHEEGPHLNEE